MKQGASCAVPAPGWVYGGSRGCVPAWRDAAHHCRTKLGLTALALQRDNQSVQRSTPRPSTGTREGALSRTPARSESSTARREECVILLDSASRGMCDPPAVSSMAIRELSMPHAPDNSWPARTACAVRATTRFRVGLVPLDVPRRSPVPDGLTARSPGRASAGALAPRLGLGHKKHKHAAAKLYLWGRTRNRHGP